jgi:hypothetical protein
LLPKHLTIAGIPALILSMAVSQALSQDQAQDEPPRAGRVQERIRQLDAAEYAEREAATQALIQAGNAAVKPLQRALADGSWEVTTRGIYILQELALSTDFATEQAALGALEELSNRTAPASGRASEVLSKLDHLRQQRALDLFTQLGARYNPEHEERDLLEGPVAALEIGRDWRGKDTDLRRLKWLRDIEQVTFEGEHVTDGWLEHLRDLESLYVLKVKGAQLTDAASVTLSELDNLRFLKLLYVPIGDESVEHLVKCQDLWRLKVYGTEISAQGAQQLIANLGVQRVDYRRGAFLGVSPANNDTGPTWFIGSIIENSAAEAAGLRAGDVVTRYGGHEVTDFESLTKLISQNNVGDHVEIEILREGKRIVRVVEFGEWD